MDLQGEVFERNGRLGFRATLSAGDKLGELAHKQLIDDGRMSLLISLPESATLRTGNGEAFSDFTLGARIHFILHLGQRINQEFMSIMLHLRVKFLS